jgi:hypothetical protein
MKKLILIYNFLLITTILFPQWNNRTFRPYYDDYDRVIGASVGHPDYIIWDVILGEYKVYKGNYEI